MLFVNRDSEVACSNHARSTTFLTLFRFIDRGEDISHNAKVSDTEIMRIRVSSIC
jgi:hypothetical protein